MAAARTARELTRDQVVLLAALAVAVVAVVAAAAVLAGKLHGASAAETRREELLQAARQQGINVTTLDHQTVDRDLARVLAGATGSFKKEFAAGTKDLKGLVTTSKAVSVGEVLEAGIVSSDSDSARVLLVVDSRVTNTAAPGGQVRHYRMQLDLARRGGRWLTSDLSFVN